MEKILAQLGGLLLQAIPTMVLLLLSFAAYQVLVDRRLREVLAERHRRGVGAIEKAQADIAAADNKAAEYEHKLREAKAAIYRVQETRRQQALEARNRALAEARAAAEALVRRERESLQRDVEAARASLAAESEKLAERVIHAILRPAQRPASALGGGQRP